VDAEPDGQPDALALGDDNNGDDEDGIVLLSRLRPGITALLEVTASAPGKLSGWIDWSCYGEFAEPIFYVRPLEAGLNYVEFEVPSWIPESFETFARFRFSTAGEALPAWGCADDGEVEDYLVEIRPISHKWIHGPDAETPGGEGLNVRATDGYVLADDFECSVSGPIVEIAIYGALNATCFVPYGRTYHLAIHADGPPAGTPGAVLWTKSFGEVGYSYWYLGGGGNGGWFYPGSDDWTPTDPNLDRYEFYVSPEEAFVQEGTPEAPVTYWLAFQHCPNIALCPSEEFGWYTSIDGEPWDCAVYASSGSFPHAGPWTALEYPTGHPYEGQPMNLAFSVETETSTGVPEQEVLSDSRLLQNTPNPFNPVTTIRFSVPEGGASTRLEIFDVSGRRVKTLVDGYRAAGPHSITWRGDDSDGRKLPSGVYFYRLIAAGATETRKMLLLK
jgi:hypothetical protein